MSCAFFALTYLREHLRDECRCSLTPSFPLIPLSLVSALSLALSSCSLSHALSRVCARSLRFRLTTHTHTHTHTLSPSLSLSLHTGGRMHARAHTHTHAFARAHTYMHVCSVKHAFQLESLLDVLCVTSLVVAAGSSGCVCVLVCVHARAYTWTLEERGASCRATRAEAII